MATYREKLFFRTAVQDEIRSFFKERNVLEVETPILQHSPGMEVHLKAFSTLWKAYEPKEFYLHFSPEFAMKKLLSLGSGDIFQFARSFRNEKKSPTHYPEFTLLEWYRIAMPYKTLMEEVMELVRACSDFCSQKTLSWNGVESNPFQEWKKMSVEEAFQKYVQIDILESLGNGIETSPDLLRREAEKIGISCLETDSWEDIFFRIFLERIEPKLGSGTPLILYEYPACMAALAKISAEDSRFAERFEVYISGLELANAFGELQDPKEQRRRFMQNMEEKKKYYGFSYPVDESFLGALERGLPFCSGIALGLERLLILLTGASHIEEVLYLPLD